MTELPVGRLDGDRVILSGNSAISVYNRGYYGQPQDNGVLLTGFEALHLLELDRIQIRNSDILTEQQVMAHFSALIADFTGRYLVYKDLRNRGYVVNQGKGSSFFFRLYRRGDVPTQESASYYITPLREGSSINLVELDDLVQLANQSKKELVFGLVDASGDVSYLKVNQLYPGTIGLDREFVDFSAWHWSQAWEDYLTWENQQ